MKAGGELAEWWNRQRLSKKIRKHVDAGKVLNRDVFALSVIAEEVMAHIDIFSSLGRRRIVSHQDS